MGAICQATQTPLNHSDISDCGKLLSIGSNKPGKQTSRVEMSSIKNIYTLYMRKVECRQQGPPAKKAKLGEVLAARCRADLVTECMKNINIIR